MNQTQFQKAAGISAGLTARWFPHITAAMKEFGITSAIDQAMFIAQCGHESMKWFTEFGHLNRGDMLTSEQHRCHNEKKKFQRRV